MRRLSRVDLGRALLALGLAFALWWAISVEQRPERTELFPSPVAVEVVNAPPRLVLTGDIPSVQVQVRAPSDAWTRLRVASFRATADAAAASPGSNELPVRVESLDRSVRAIEPVPPSIRVVMEELTERVVPVRLSLTGSVPFGYIIGQAVVAPQQVTAVGPASLVGRVQEALVEIPLDQLTLPLKNVYQPLPMDARRDRVLNVRLNPASVTAEVPIAQSVSYKEVGIRPVLRGRLAPGYLLEPLELNPPSVTVVGEPSQLNNVTVIETEPIDVSGLSATTVRQVSLSTGSGVSVLGAQLRPVSVTIRVSPIRSTQTLQVAPTATGLGPELELAEPPVNVAVTFSGPAPTLQGLSARDFRVTLDLSGREAGTHSVQPRVELPGGFTLESITPAQVTVVLRRAPAAAFRPT